MNYVKEYLREIQKGNIAACVKIRSVYEREVEWMENPPENFKYHFDEHLADKHIKFIETFCKQSKGLNGGQPLELQLFQKAKIQLLFGWVDDDGYRRFRECVDIRARKNGKSTEAAGLAHDLLLNDGENGPEVYVVANSRDQAKLVFNECTSMRAKSPALRTIEKKRQSDIYTPFNDGIIKPLAAKTNNLDGLNAHGVIQDEWHEQKNSALYDVMVQSQSAREQPLYLLISTNGFLREAFFDAKYEYASNVALWVEGYHDYRTLALIYELDSREEWIDESCWEKANPGLRTIKKISTLRANVEKAKVDKTFLPTVLTKDFNLFVNSSEGWLEFQEAVNKTVVPMEYLEHSYAIGGCDLSAVGDLTCASLLIRKPNDDNIYVLQKYFLPQSKMDELNQGSNKKTEAPYDIWHQNGWITVCNGSRVNYSDVTGWFWEMVTDHDIRPLWVCYDRALSGYWVPEMEEKGFDMEAIPQGPYTWTYPMKELHAQFKEHKVIYQNNPVLRWCLLNTSVKTLNKGGIESIQPEKASYNKRIDGMVSLLNAYTGYVKHLDEFLPYLR